MNEICSGGTRAGIFVSGKYPLADLKKRCLSIDLYPQYGTYTRKYVYGSLVEDEIQVIGGIGCALRELVGSNRPWT